MSIQIRWGRHVLKDRDGFPAVLRLSHRESNQLQQLGQQQAVLQVVIHHQQAPGWLASLQPDDPCRWFLGCLIDARLRQLHRDGDPEQRSPAQLAFHPDLAAHHLYQPFRNRQAQSGSLLTVAGGFTLYKGFKDLIPLLVGDSGARVFHL